MSCPRCSGTAVSQGNFCDRCGHPAVDAPLPRAVRMKTTLGNLSKFVLIPLFVLAALLVIADIFAGPLLARRYGDPEDAVIQGAFRDTLKDSEIWISVTFTDRNGIPRQDRVAGGESDLANPKVGAHLPIHYLRVAGLGLAQRDDQAVDEGSLWLPLLPLGLFVFAFVGQVRNLLRNRRMLARGRILKATVLEVGGGKIKRVKVDAGPAGILMCRGIRFPKIGGQVWVVDNGPRDGRAILEYDFEWVCV